MRKVRCGTYRPSKSVKKMLQDSLKIKLPVKILKKVSVLEQIEQHCSLTKIQLDTSVEELTLCFTLLVVVLVFSPQNHQNC